MDTRDDPTRALTLAVLAELAEESAQPPLPPPAELTEMPPPEVLMRYWQRDVLVEVSCPECGLTQEICGPYVGQSHTEGECGAGCAAKVDYPLPAWLCDIDEARFLLRESWNG